MAAYQGPEKGSSGLVTVEVVKIGVWDLGLMFLFGALVHYPYAPRTHMLRLLGPKTLLCKAFGLF